MKAKSIAELEPSVILLICLKRYLVLKTNFQSFESSRFTQVLLYSEQTRRSVRLVGVFAERIYHYIFFSNELA